MSRALVKGDPDGRLLPEGEPKPSRRSVSVGAACPVTLEPALVVWDQGEPLLWAPGNYGFPRSTREVLPKQVRGFLQDP